MSSSDIPSPHLNTVISIPKIPIGIGIALAIVVVTASVTYYFGSVKTQQALVFFAAATAAAGQLAATFYAARVLEFSARSTSDAARSEEVARRADRALRYAERWNDPTMFHVRQVCQKIINVHPDQAEVRKIIDNDSASEINVKHVLNFLEEMAGAINAELCDESLARRLFCGIVVNLWHSVDFYVREHRERRKRPAIWVDLESLYDRWKTYR